MMANEATGERELTRAELNRQDCVDNSVWDALNDLARDLHPRGVFAYKRQHVARDVAKIATVREIVREMITESGEGAPESERAFYPYLADSG
jgi:hypothetical protein